MKSPAPSPTALRVAALRALHQVLDVPPVFIDPLAERILGPDARALIDGYRSTANYTVHLRATLAARGMFAAATIAEAIERNVDQFIILGAGLDTFAYRHTFSHIRVYEVDHPKVQAWKRQTLREAKIDAPSTLTYIGTDFERDNVLSALIEAGFDPLRPAVFIMLGVSFYLRKATLLALLGQIATACVRGTEIIFDYSEPLDRASQAAKARYEKAATRVAAEGEPWITFFIPADINEALRNIAFSEVKDLDAVAQNTQWFEGRTDGLAVAPLAHLVRARR